MDKTKPATLPQLLALRDALLRFHDKDAAAAADNLIDLLRQRNEPDGTEPSSGSEVYYDYTPIPSDMPVIDMEKIKEIPF